VVKQRILIAANSDLSFDQRLLRISRSLNSNGYRPYLLGRWFEKSVALSKESFPQSRIRLVFQKGKMAYLELNIRLFFTLLNLEYDAICSVDLDTLPACWLATRIRQIPLIHDAHEYMAEVPEVYNRPLTKRIWHSIARICLPAVDLAYTVSQSLVEEFGKIYQKEFHLIRNIAHLDTTEEYVETEGFWVFLGAVNQGRGLEQFISLLHHSNRNLVIVGDGDKMEEIQRLVNDKKLNERVVFAGKLSATEVRKILPKAWAGINLLTDEGLSYRYSLANKFFDYVHAGIPQISIRFPEYETLMKEFSVGILTDMTESSILLAMEEISTEENQPKFRNEARKARNVWNWQNEEKKMIRLYDQLFD
jgi:Glycosyltransferase Family 4/Glycosyl transferases group 1